MKSDVQITIIGGKKMTVPRGTTLLEIAEANKEVCKYPILAATLNNGLAELTKKVNEDCEIDFLDITKPNGFRVYQRSVSFLMIYAAKEIIGKTARIIIEHSINKNYYCEIIHEDIKVTKPLLLKIERKMHEMVEKDVLIEKYALPVEDSIRIANEFGLLDKVMTMKFRRTANVNFYKLDWLYDYFYGQMAISTGCIPKFKLIKEGNGFFLCFPSRQNPDEITEFDASKYKKITSVFNESNKWARILKVDTVGALNEMICDGKQGRLIRINEALHEKRIANIADMIYQQKRNIVLIAGPSSSGKTTFANRLCVQLSVNGLRPSVISLDHYYLNRENAPLDAYGKPDFESLHSLDVKQINKDLLALINGDEVEIPTFNFLTGKREYKGHRIMLKEDDVLVIEGIHGLNDALSQDIPRNRKFKVFISALTQLNIDDHNRIPTTDTRLIRRIVRDNQFRGFDVSETIAMWSSVIRGEEVNIFPFQEEADAFFNSALVYEMCVLKQYAEPLLFRIDKSSSQYTEARRLIKFLDGFLCLPSDDVPVNSILREFVGGSCFK